MSEHTRYQQPAKGETDWHKPLNQNFAKLDTDVEIRDAEASLSSYEPKPGAKFLATDTERAFIGDGEQWRALASHGKAPSFDTVSENISQSFGEYVVYESGNEYHTKRTADGQVVASDRDVAAVIQHAIDALPEEGGIVVVGSVDASPNQSIDISKSNVALVGQGRNATRFDVRGGGTPEAAIDINGNGSQITDIFVRDMRVKAGDIGVRAEWVNTIRLTNIEVNAADRGFVLNHHYDFIHRHLNANYCEIGFESTDDLNGGLFERCQALDCSEAGWDIDDVTGGNPRYIHWDSCKASDPGGQGMSHGFVGKGLEGCTITNFHSEDVDGGGVALELTAKSGSSKGDVDYASRANSVQGGFLFDCSTGIRIDCAENTRIEGCQFRPGDVSGATGLEITSEATGTWHGWNEFKDGESADSGGYANEIIDNGDDTNALTFGRLRSVDSSSHSNTADSMTADPEQDSEDGWIEVIIDDTSYQIPIYEG